MPKKSDKMVGYAKLYVDIYGKAVPWRPPSSDEETYWLEWIRHPAGLKCWLKQHGKFYYHLAKKIKCHQETLGLWLRCFQKPSTKYVYRIREYIRGYKGQ